MSSADESQQLPANIADVVSGIPKALIPASIKALDRLVGASLDIPVAWLVQQKARIEAQTAAYSAVETAIAEAAAKEAGATPEIIQQAVNILVRKSYRKQSNVEAVSVAAIEDLRSTVEESVHPRNENAAEIEDDWLNVFERYAEDASTERMQNLWGRVLAGEIRRPGRFSMRTLRFLSEFSQADALNFAAFAGSVFGDIAPETLVKPADKRDQRDLIYLESNGLIQGATGMGLQWSLNINAAGVATIKENNLFIVFRGIPGTEIACRAVALTPLGQELLSLLPGRDARAAARTVASALRSPQITSAYIGIIGQELGRIVPVEILWQGEEPGPVP